jgi:hypothetical protein
VVLIHFSGVIPRYAVICTDDTSGPYQTLADSYLTPYTLIQTTGGHQFFVFDPNGFAKILSDIYVELPEESNSGSPRSSSQTSCASSLVQNVCVLLVLCLAIF